MLTGVTYSEVLKVMQTDGAALTTNNVSTSIITPQAKPLIKANSLFVGKMFRIDVFGQITQTVTPSTAHALNVLIGSSNIFTTTLTNFGVVATNATLALDLLLTCRAIGSAANFMVGGTLRANSGSSGIFINELPNAAPAVGGNFDNTIDQLLDLQFLIQTSSITSIQLNQFIFESLN